MGREEAEQQQQQVPKDQRHQHQQEEEESTPPLADAVPITAADGSMPVGDCIYRASDNDNDAADAAVDEKAVILGLQEDLRSQIRADASSSTTAPLFPPPTEPDPESDHRRIPSEPGAFSCHGNGSITYHEVATITILPITTATADDEQEVMQQDFNTQIVTDSPRALAQEEEEDLNHNSQEEQHLQQTRDEEQAVPRLQNRSSTNNNLISNVQAHGQEHLEEEEHRNNHSDQDEAEDANSGMEDILPIAAELAPDHDALLLEMEAQIRQEWEQRMMLQQSTSIASIATASHGRHPSSERIRIEAVEFDRSLAFDISDNDGDDADAYHNSTGNHHKHTSRGFSNIQRALVIGIPLLLVLITAVLLGIIFGIRKNHYSNPALDQEGPQEQLLLPTLQAIQERGFLRCKPESLEAEKGTGFSVDLCYAIAAAVFNTSDINTIIRDKVTYPHFPFKEHFGAIQRGELDVSAAHVSLNMGRDVREEHSRSGYTYSTPYFYTGTALAGVPKFVDCAEAAETFDNDCRHLQVCVAINTVTQDIVEAHLPGSAMKLVESHGDLFSQFADGTCNVIAGDTVNIFEQRVRDAGYVGEYKFANRLLSHEHLALLTRQEDPEWADLCNWVLQALIKAEALNITQESANAFFRTNLFGPKYKNMFVHAIAAVGNYQEMYDRHYGASLPRSQYNSINFGDSGLIVSNPFGTLLVEEELIPEDELPKPEINGTMQAVIARGTLACGLISLDGDGKDRIGFAEYNGTANEWSGMDVDYCRGLAASVSAGGYIHTVFMDLSDRDVRYRSLANGTVDIVAGERLRLVSDVNEPTTRTGFTFGVPYFYEESGSGRALMTRHQDRQWSDLAHWITQATFYAEEVGITQATASQMPVVELFGIKYKQMFRDAIHATGSYAELYDRNIESFLRRSGRNQLNDKDTAQFYPAPFDS